MSKDKTFWRIKAETFFVATSDLGYAPRSKELANIFTRIHQEAFAEGLKRAAEIAENWNPNDYHWDMPKAMADTILKEAEGK